MSIWYALSLGIVGLALLIVIGSAIVAAVGAKEPGMYIVGRGKKMVENVKPIQAEVTALQSNVTSIQTTVAQQKAQIQSVGQSFASVKDSFQQLQLQAKNQARQLITKAENDPVVQENVEMYTEKVASTLQR
ncbi:hypothetical protein [Caryophanon latum]|uniref:DUF948 domain-containing protein n=1 Tax=Caryophanon latum TaxID=33977 RepID=A0A1C0YBL2_9BACL|nr:hypothetical protein [Caryophanon latum]OCS84568.1 hypothetical protein A6K76_15510 [Caryophanon latum]